jgi:hypothetical protein
MKNFGHGTAFWHKFSALCNVALLIRSAMPRFFFSEENKGTKQE